MALRVNGLTQGLVRPGWITTLSPLPICLFVFVLQISDSLVPKFAGGADSPAVKFATLQYALYITSFVCVLGGGFFLTTAMFVEKDKNKADRQIRGKTQFKHYSPRLYQLFIKL